MIQLNWGHKLAIVIVLFLVAMLAMVFYAARQDNEMIDENYYQKELGYQDLIDAQKNLLAVTANNIVSQDMDEVIFTLPIGTFEGLDSGRVELLRTDAERLDRFLDLRPDGTNRRSIAKAELSAGVYRARIRWTSKGVPYYKEESVYVEKQP
jgi:hypothetical protein